MKNAGEIDPSCLMRLKYFTTLTFLTSFVSEVKKGEELAYQSFSLLNREFKVRGSFVLSLSLSSFLLSVIFAQNSRYDE